MVTKRPNLEDVWPGLDSPAQEYGAVTPDAAVSPPFRALYIGTAGDVEVRQVNGSTEVTFANVPAGTVLPVTGDMVVDAGTTASDIVWLR
jgi:hypothetical protein